MTSETGLWPGSGGLSSQDWLFVEVFKAVKEARQKELELQRARMKGGKTNA